MRGRGGRRMGMNLLRKRRRRFAVGVQSKRAASKTVAEHENIGDPRAFRVI